MYLYVVIIDNKLKLDLQSIRSILSGFMPVKVFGFTIADDRLRRETVSTTQINFNFYIFLLM